ncbi:unnamed protein product [Mytilus coruscus]|uniref:C2H2-type domain-containing protein n=1 Tax=Mytilus coruscus TaxID=42192 RepID=A0A6J8B7I5_MYTCO|nr:unnamed protein product [Mytilus coruscus]
MSTEEPLNIMAEDEIFDKEKFIEFYYSTDMRCPIADCDFGGRFLTKTKYSRHWEERHISSVQKYECPIQYCRGVLRRRSDMKSHIKFVHGEKNDTRIEEITLKSRKIVEHSKNFINPGFFVFKGRTQKSVDSSKPTTSTTITASNISTATTSTTVTAPVNTVTSNVPVIASQVNVTSSVVPSPMVISKVLASAYNLDDDIQFNVHIPACLPVTSHDISTTAPKPSSSPLISTKTRVSIEDYRNRPAKESHLPIFEPLITSVDNCSQTCGMDVKEVYLPPIPDTIEEIQEHIRTLCDLMDKIGRQREASKGKLEVLRKEGPSLQKEKEMRKKLESGNRELKRQLSEVKWRENLFPAEMES